MNAVQLLKKDHQTVKELFKQYEEAGERAHQKKQRIAEHVCEALEAHTTIEEEIFYPAVAAEADKEEQSLVSEAVEEHHVVKVLIAELRKLEASDERFDAKFTVLRENVEHHVEEEEGEMFPSAEESLGDELDRLGQQMEQRKSQLLATASKT